MIGFDDLPMARWVGPPLTTIRQPLTEMAATAARLVLGQAEDRRVELATTLVVRQSTHHHPMKEERTMVKSVRCALGVVAAAALIVAGCGGADDKSGSGGDQVLRRISR